VTVARHFGKTAAIDTIEHLRDIPALRPLRGRHPAVVVCGDGGEAWEGFRAQLAALDAELVVERDPGPLSQRLGRPSVTVTDRYLDVALRGEQLDPDEVVKTVRWLEIRCEECPQSGVDMGQRASDWG
jgi:hypothetical protein